MGDFLNFKSSKKEDVHKSQILKRRNLRHNLDTSNILVKSKDYYRRVKHNEGKSLQTTIQFFTLLRFTLILWFRPQNYNESEISKKSLRSEELRKSCENC